LSSPVWDDRWPILPPSSSVCAFAIGPLAEQSFTFAVAVTGDNVIAALTAGRKHFACNAAKPTAAINNPPKGGRIIATASATTASASAPA
jgi:hypothetical protein